MEGHVSLTQEEEALFSLLLEVVKEMSTQSVLRVAGGWVRDKVRKNDLRHRLMFY